MSNFLYQMDDLEFRLPWAPPDMLRLRLWYVDLLRQVGSLGNFQIYLSGGVWAANSVSWDADLYLCPQDGFIDIKNMSALEKAYQIMFAGYLLALNEHRFLIDFTLASKNRIFGVYETLRNSENMPESTVVDPSPGETILGIFNRYRKVRDGQEEFSYTKQDRGVIDLGHGRRFFIKPITSLEKQVRHIKAGRVYHKPVLLEKLVV